jgi:dienelactone hydrolase
MSGLYSPQDVLKKIKGLVAGPTTDAFVSLAESAGPLPSVLIVQELMGLDPDGLLTEKFASSYAGWIGSYGWDATTSMILAKKNPEAGDDEGHDEGF